MCWVVKRDEDVDVDADDDENKTERTEEAIAGVFILNFDTSSVRHPGSQSLRPSAKHHQSVMLESLLAAWDFGLPVGLLPA